jgi:hypothetical protein
MALHQLSLDSTLTANALDAARTQYEALQKSFNDSADSGDVAALARLKALKDEIEGLEKAAQNFAATKPLDPVAESIRRIQDSARIAAAPRNQRAQLSAEAAIQNQYRDDLNAGGPIAAGAAARRDAALAALPSQLNQQTKDAIAGLNDQADAQRKLADAYELGTAAAARQKIVNDAHLAYLAGATRDEKAYADALLSTAQATAQASSAAAVMVARENNEDLKRLAAAGGNPAALAAAKRENEAQDTTKGERDLVSSAESASVYQQHLQQLRDELSLRDQINLQIQDNQEDVQLQKTLQERQLELSLMAQSADSRAKELADIQTRNELMAQGWSADMPGFDEELAKRTALNEQIGQTEAALRQAQNAQRQWQSAVRSFGDTLSNAFEAATAPGAKLRDVWQGFEQDLAKVIERLAVINPLLNALSNAVPGAGTTQAPTLFGASGILSAAFGGGTSYIPGTSMSSMGGIQNYSYSDASGGSGFFSSLFGDLFADGGIMTARGRVPLRRYSAGGIATSPQMAIFGEGSTPEAYVPVPSGRIPVQLSGQGGARNVTTHNWYIDARGADASVVPQIKALAQSISAINGSIETRAVRAIAHENARNPNLLAR